MFMFWKYLTLGKKIKLIFMFIILGSLIPMITNILILRLFLFLSLFFSFITIGNLATFAKKDEMKKKMHFKEDVENEYIEENKK